MGHKEHASIKMLQKNKIFRKFVFFLNQNLNIKNKVKTLTLAFLPSNQHVSPLALTVVGAHVVYTATPQTIRGPFTLINICIKKNIYGIYIYM